MNIKVSFAMVRVMVSHKLCILGSFGSSTALRRKIIVIIYVHLVKACNARSFSIAALKLSPLPWHWAMSPRLQNNNV
jgi:hypothetical protein